MGQRADGVDRALGVVVPLEGASRPRRGLLNQRSNLGMRQHRSSGSPHVGIILRVS